MDFRDSLSADLPAPRDDEPAGLRREILDELADHLACSYNRELLRGADPREARRRALERFGDPAAVARRLWLDAMRGKIMAQRVLIATCLVMMSACFGVVGMVWSASSRSAAEAAEANRRLAEVLGQTQDLNHEMLRQLQAIAKASQSPKSPDWIPVRFRLTMEKRVGPPAVGYQLRLGRGHLGSQKSDAIHRLSDSGGVADFGVVQPGDWEYAIEAGPWKATGGLNVVPGTSVVKEIACPRYPAKAVQVKVRVDWPGSLADKNLIAVASFRQESETYQPPLVWSSQSQLHLVCRSRGEAVILDQDLRLFTPYETITELSSTLQINEGAYIDAALPGGGIHGQIPLDPSLPRRVPFDAWAGRFSLARLMIFRPLSNDPETGIAESRLLAVLNQDQDGVQVQVMNNNQLAQVRFVQGRRMSPSFLDRFGHFEARSGEAAEWVIMLPEDLVKEAEKGIRPDPPSVKPS